MIGPRLATAAVAIPALLLLIFVAPAWAINILVGLLGVVALTEYAGMAFRGRAAERAIAVGVGLIALVAAVASPAPGPVPTAGLATAVCVGLFLVVLRTVDPATGFRDLAVTLIGVLYVGMLFPHFVWLRYLGDGPRWMTFVIATCMASDTGAYFVGKAFGRRRLIPRVSPGKTVEGAVGNLLSGVLIGAAAKWLLLPQRGLGEIVVLAAVMSVVGQLGDLSESVMKRTFDTKESGWIFPGHGGVLDRIDSLLFPGALVYYYVLLG